MPTLNAKKSTKPKETKEVKNTGKATTKKPTKVKTTKKTGGTLTETVATRKAGRVVAEHVTDLPGLSDPDLWSTSSASKGAAKSGSKDNEKKPLRVSRLGHGPVSSEKQNSSGLQRIDIRLVEDVIKKVAIEDFLLRRKDAWESTKISLAEITLYESKTKSDGYLYKIISQAAKLWFSTSEYLAVKWYSNSIALFRWLTS